MVEGIVRTFPAIIDVHSRINIETQRTADALVDIKRGFKAGFMDLRALNRIMTLPKSLKDIRNEETKMINYEEYDSRLVFEFSRPKNGDNCKILKIIPFRQFQDDDSDLTYSGPKYIIANATSNCTSFIEPPSEFAVHDKCATVNATISSDQPL